MQLCYSAYLFTVNTSSHLQPDVVTATSSSAPAGNMNNHVHHLHVNRYVLLQIHKCKRW